MMASSLHNAHHAWISHVLADLLYTGHLTSIEHTELIAESATSEYGCIPVNFPRLHNAAFHNFTGIYAGSEKAADFTITPYIGRYPSIVFECGWSESFSRLRQDKDLWFGGCGGAVELVILIKFNKLAGGSVSGMIEVWAGESATNNRLIQTEVIANLPCKYKKNARLTAVVDLSCQVRRHCYYPVNSHHPIAAFWA